MSLNFKNYGMKWRMKWNSSDSLDQRKTNTEERLWGKHFFIYNYIFYIIIFFKTLELKVTSKQNVGYGF